MTDRKPIRAHLGYCVPTCLEEEVRELEAYTERLEKQIEAIRNRIVEDKNEARFGEKDNSYCFIKMYQLINFIDNWQIKEGE